MTRTHAHFIEWLSGAAIYIGYARYGQLGGHGFVCVSNYDDADDLLNWTQDLDGGDDEALRAADQIRESGAWYGNDPNPAEAMKKLMAKMEHYYFHELNGGAMSNDKAWDPDDVYSTDSYPPSVRRFTPEVLAEAAAGMYISCDDLEWIVSYKQLQEWGAGPNSICEWNVEGPTLCWFTIDGRRVAKGERSAEGIYSWTPQCTCLDDEDSGGNRFKDWDEDCPLHGRRATANTRDGQA